MGDLENRDLENRDLENQDLEQLEVLFDSTVKESEKILFLKRLFANLETVDSFEDISQTGRFTLTTKYYRATITLCLDAPPLSEIENAIRKRNSCFIVVTNDLRLHCDLLERVFFDKVTVCVCLSSGKEERALSSGWEVVFAGASVVVGKRTTGPLHEQENREIPAFSRLAELIECANWASVTRGPKKVDIVADQLNFLCQGI